jgi:hypothetical protein
LVMGAPPGALPGAPPGAYGNSRRCELCGGMLNRTAAAGRPRQKDHLADCGFFPTARQAMQYSLRLRRTASGSTGISRGIRRYLEDRSAELARAACSGNPPAQLSQLARKYKAERSTDIEKVALSELLSQSCQTLAQGGVPGPSPLLPES